jgi:hypothetical protein
MGPGKQVVKEVHEGPAGYKRRTRKGATVKASQWEVVREESWKLERGEDERGLHGRLDTTKAFARTCISCAHTLGSFSQANIECL